jgi:hypothetical protein
LREWAATNRPDVIPDLEAAKFLDYWTAKSGQVATKCDWLATWRNWIRNARAAPTRRAPPQTMESAVDREAEALRCIRERRHEEASCGQ